MSNSVSVACGYGPEMNGTNVSALGRYGDTRAVAVASRRALKAMQLAIRPES